MPPHRIIATGAAPIIRRILSWQAALCNLMREAAGRFTCGCFALDQCRAKCLETCRVSLLPRLPRLQHRLPCLQREFIHNLGAKFTAALPQRGTPNLATSVGLGF